MASVNLRDRTALTRLLILRELHERGRASLTEVAHALGITVQAVSLHARAMEKEGFLARASSSIARGNGASNGGGRGAYAPTGRGLAELAEGFRDLKRVVDDAVRSLGDIRVASARAVGAVHQNERVGLFMERGELVARANTPSPSTGRALADAAHGHEVVVGELAGVVDLQPGSIAVVRVPGPAEGGSGAVDEGLLRKLVEEVPRDVVAAHGAGARVLAERLTGRDADLVFAPAQAAVNAAELGLHVLYVVSGDLLRDDLDVFEAANLRTHHRIAVRLLEAPTGMRR